MRARYSILDFGLISAIFFTFLGVVLPHTRRMACSAYCPCLNRMLIGACNPMLFPIHVSKGIGHGLAVLAHSPTAHAHKRDSSLAVSFSNVSTLLGLCAATGKKGIAQCTNGVVHGYQGLQKTMHIQAWYCGLNPSRKKVLSEQRRARVKPLLTSDPRMTTAIHLLSA